VRRHFSLKDHSEIAITADFFNLLNRVNITDFDTVYGQPTLALPPVSTFATPRQVGNAFQTQLGIRLTF
jgi:hypothetical protein